MLSMPPATSTPVPFVPLAWIVPVLVLAIVPIAPPEPTPIPVPPVPFACTRPLLFTVPMLPPLASTAVPFVPLA